MIYDELESKNLDASYPYLRPLTVFRSYPKRVNS
jgi:hypothetical protein